jgi:hypothetical protein
MLPVETFCHRMHAGQGATAGIHAPQRSPRAERVTDLVGRPVEAVSFEGPLTVDSALTKTRAVKASVDGASTTLSPPIPGGPMSNDRSQRTVGRLAGKRIIVTGGAQGIGEATVRA